MLLSNRQVHAWPIDWRHECAKTILSPIFYGGTLLSFLHEIKNNKYTKYKEVSMTHFCLPPHTQISPMCCTGFEVLSTGIV